MKKNLILLSLLAFSLAFISCNNYGTKLMFDETELYYTDDITEDEANDIGKYLQELEFTDGEEKTVQIAKDGDTYQFRMVVKEGYDEDEEYEQIASQFIYNLSNDVLDGSPVELHMCDEKLKTIKVVEMDENAGIYETDFEIETFDGTEIEFDGSVSYGEVNKLGNYLIETGFTDGTLKSIVFIKENGSYIFKMVVGEDYWNDSEYHEIAKEYAGMISQDIFDGEDFAIYLCDDYFNTKAKIKM